MISSKFPKSFRGACHKVVLGDFSSMKNPEKSQNKHKHHQVKRTPKTLLKLTWNHLTVLWLNFEKNQRLHFAFHGPSPIHNRNLWILKKTYFSTICSWLSPVFLGLNFLSSSRVEMGLMDRAARTCSTEIPLLGPPAGGESRLFFPDGPVGELLCSSRTRFSGPTGVGARFDC